MKYSFINIIHLSCNEFPIVNQVLSGLATAATESCASLMHNVEFCTVM